MILIPDLVPLVLSHVSRKDIYECMKVCKQWNSMLAPMYYKSVVLRYNTHFKFVKCLVRTRFDGSKVGDFVTAITICEHSQDRHYLKEQEFYQLIGNLPAVQQIFLSAYHPYLKFLLTIPTSYLQQIKEISPVRRCMYIKDGPVQTATATTLDMALASIRFKDTIRSFWLEHFPYFEMNHMDVISEFPNLNHLYITDNRRELFSILNGYKLNLHSFVSIILSRWGNIASETIAHNNLTKFQIYVYDFEEKHVDYFIQNMPNLKTLTIYIGSKGVVKVLSRLSKKTIQRFGQYLKRVNDMVIQDVKARDTVGDAYLRGETLLAFLQAIHEPNQTCDLNIHFTPLPMFKDRVIFESHGRKLYINAMWLTNMFGTKIWTKQIEFLNLESLKIINTCANLYGIQSRSIHANSTLLINPVIKLLKQQKQPCPIAIKNMRRLLYFFNIKKEKSLPLLLHQVCPQEIEKIHEEKRNINFGYIRKILITKDLLVSLGQLYPFVKQITLDRCIIEPTKERSQNYNINLSEFKNIQWLTFDLDAMLSVKELKHTLYILINHASGMECYYYTERPQRLFRPLPNRENLRIPQSAYVTRILCNKIQRITFTRKKKVIFTIKLIN